jgi:uncharacterized protein (UPF0264 family)
LRSVVAIAVGSQVLFLCVGHIDKRPDLLSQVRIFAVFHQADYFDIGVYRVARAKREMATDGILSWKEGSRHFLAYNCYFGRSGTIAIVELPPSEQGNSQR